MKKNGSIMAIVLCLFFCLILSACGQANSVPETTPEPTVVPTPEPSSEPLNYVALAAKLNGDIVSPVEEAEARLEEAQAKKDSETPSDNSGVVDDSETENTAPEMEIDTEKLQNALISGGVFEAEEDCVIYRFWSAGIDKELFDLLGSDGTESSATVHSELLKTFVANYDALQKAVALYEPDAVLVLHVVENSESTDPIIVVENGEVTYDYASEKGYFVAEEELAEDTSVGEAVG